MKQESSSSEAWLTFDKPIAVYDILARSMLAQQYEKAFLDATGLLVKLVPSDEPAQFFRRLEHPFCRLMVQSKGSCAACQEVHEQLHQRVADSLVPQTICCFAGLAEFAVPVVVSGHHVATILGGQVFQHKPTQEQFARLTQQFHVWGMQRELQQIEKTLFQTPVISQKKFQASIQLLAIFTKLLAEDVNRDLLTAHADDGPCITIAKNFILTHISEPLRLRDVAEHIHVSTHYFCKFFKKATGIGFSEFLARARIENAKQALANSVLPISEVADQAGFGSLSQFNRTFRRYVGCSPKEYRASLQ